MLDAPSVVIRLFRTLSLAVAVLGSLVLVCCGLLPQQVTYDDPEVQALLRARDAAGAERYGFTPVPASAEIRIERTPHGGYDHMLHVQAATSRTIAFRSTGEGYVWIGEQEIFEGPNEYTSADGISRERVTLNYELEPISGHRTKTLVIRYRGEDARLARRNDLTLGMILPVLREWGYLPS